MSEWPLEKLQANKTKISNLILKLFKFLGVLFCFMVRSMVADAKDDRDIGSDLGSGKELRSDTVRRTERYRE